MLTKQRIKIVILNVIVLGVLSYHFFKDREISYGPGVIAPERPHQKRITNVNQFNHNGYTIRPIASFNVKARVLSRKNYNYDRESDLSPLDLALGWGPMSDESITDKISVSQSHRAYRWRVKTFPISRREIEINSANMHMIPASHDIREQMKKIKKGHTIEFEGYLVEIVGSGGWRWKSSLSRTDIGAHSCEVVWVETIQIL